MSLLRKLLQTLGYRKPPRLSFEMDGQLVRSLQELAESEQRPKGEIAADLISFALLQREQAEEKLQQWHDLSERERQVAALTCHSYTNREIAASLQISPETVKTHVRNVLRKFGVRSKAELRRTLSDWDFSAWYKSQR